MNIIRTNIAYSSTVFYNDLQNLIKTFSFLRTKIIGYSVLGNPIYVAIVGNGKKNVFYSGAYHANEWITSPLLMKFIEDICSAYVSNANLCDYSIRNLLSETTIHICPMVNPDGVDLVTSFLPTTSSSYINAKKISERYPSISFPNGWKANITGVDLKNLQPICKVL